MLIEIASKGGNFLMNVGPRPDGELSQTEYDALAGIGSWMDQYSESIYETNKSLFLDLPWGHSTTKGRTLYMHVLDWPTNGVLRIPGLRNDIRRAYLLSDPRKKRLKIKVDGEDKLVSVGPNAPHPVASVVAVEIKGDPDINNVYRQKGDAPIELGSGIASIESETAQYNFGKATRKGNFIQDIESAGDRISWDFLVQTPGTYRVFVQYATQNDQAGSRYTVRFGSDSFAEIVEGTAQWEGDILEVRRREMDEGERHNNLWLFKDFEIGTIEIDSTGKHQLSLTADSIARDYLMFLKSITLVPSK